MTEGWDLGQAGRQSSLLVVGSTAANVARDDCHAPSPSRVVLTCSHPARGGGAFVNRKLAERQPCTARVDVELALGAQAAVGVLELPMATGGVPDLKHRVGHAVVLQRLNGGKAADPRPDDGDAWKCCVGDGG